MLTRIFGMKNQFLGLCVMVLFAVSGEAQQTVEWLSFGEAIEKSKVERKKIFVDVYTKWCGWCKKMDKATFQDPQIANYINENYYAVKFDAEDRNSIDFKDKTYKFVKSGRRGYHELAAAITKGNLRYPTVVFLDENLNVIQPIPGYQDAKSFEMIMTYFAEDFFKNTPWRKYKQEYVPLDKRGKVPSKVAGYNKN